MMSNRLRAVIILAGAALLGTVALGAIVVFVVRPGTDPSRLLSFLGQAIVPSAVALFAVARVETKVEKVAETVDTVQEQTNGALHALVETVQRQAGPPDNGQTG